MVKELSEEGSEESSDNLSDSRSSENNSSAISQEGRRGRWMRRGIVPLHTGSLIKSHLFAMSFQTFLCCKIIWSYLYCYNINMCCLFVI